VIGLYITEPNLNPKENEEIRKDLVHFILSHSYLAYLLAIIFGVIFDLFIPIRIFHRPIWQNIGFFIIILSTILIYWAQRISGSRRKGKDMINGKHRFDRGPYRFSRSPTHLGLSLATLGFGLMAGSFFIFLFMILVIIITKIIFLRKEENLLERKYGEDYSDYKKRIKTWL
jgi:protein-S-isoprenylcysteine O-methyltransferase Ste14